MRCLRVSSDLPSPDDEGETKVVSVNGPACLWLTKGANNHEVSLHAIGLDCLWIAKVWITMRCLYVSLDLPSLDDEGETKVVLVNELTYLWLTKVRLK